MRLLVSVSGSGDAAAALAGGAELIDAKNPDSGALGAVSLATFGEIVGTVAGARPVSAALGDTLDSTQAETMAESFVNAGASLVKVGFLRVAALAQVERLIAAAVRGARRARPGSGVVAVAYADAPLADSVSLLRLIEVAACVGAHGVLVDTANKSGAGLRELVAPRALRRWAAAAHEARLTFALAGRLTANDLPFARDAGADIAGVRSAACEGGRSGRVVAELVHQLRLRCAKDDQMTAGPSI